MSRHHRNPIGDKSGCVSMSASAGRTLGLFATMLKLTLVVGRALAADRHPGGRTCND